MIIGVSAGAKVVAEAGLLDGRRATTHWYYLKGLRDKHPAIDHVADRRLVVDQGVATTAAISSPSRAARTFAGNIATSNAISPYAAAGSTVGTSKPTAPASSRNPVTVTSSAGAGRLEGTIAIRGGRSTALLPAVAPDRCQEFWVATVSASPRGEGLRFSVAILR